MSQSAAVSRLRSEPLYLAIDQGGQSSKALVFDRSGRLEASRAVAVGTRRPRPGWVEQDPAELLESVRTAVAAVVADLGEGVDALQAAGLATQRSSVLCWDRGTGEPLTPVISWQDRRGETGIQELRSDEQRVREITGLVLSSHYGAAKIRWCLDHLTGVREAQRQKRLCCGPLASFLLFHLCRERPLVVDPAIAARTLLWDLEALDWSRELLAGFGVPKSVLPTCVPSRYDFGHLEVRGAEIPMVVSTGDQSAAFFAEGMPAAEIAVVNLGTGAFLQKRSMRRRTPRIRLLRSMVWQEATNVIEVLEGSINGCGSALAEKGAELGFDSDAVGTLSEEWLAAPGRPPLFLNGVSGLGSPYWVADYPTQLVGSGEPRQVMVAVYESIVFLLQVNLEAMSRELEAPRQILVTGGLAASDGLCQRLANLTRTETVRPEIREATARGLARLIAGPYEGTSGNLAGDRFTPQSDGPLEERFRSWRDELEARLPRSEP